MTPQQDLFEDTETQLAQKSNAPSVAPSKLFWGTTVTGSVLASLLGYFVGSHTGTQMMEEKSGEDLHEKDEQLNEQESNQEVDRKKQKKNEAKLEALKGIKEQIKQAKAIEVDDKPKWYDSLTKMIGFAESGKRQGSMAQQKQAGPTTQRARQANMAQSKNVKGPVRANGRTIGVAQRQAGSVARNLNQYGATKMAETNPYLAI